MTLQEEIITCLRETIMNGTFKGISSCCIDGTFIVYGDEPWDDSIINLKPGTYKAFRDYINLKKLNTLIEKFKKDKMNADISPIPVL